MEFRRWRDNPPKSEKSSQEDVFISAAWSRKKLLLQREIIQNKHKDIFCFLLISLSCAERFHIAASLRWSVSHLTDTAGN